MIAAARRGNSQEALHLHQQLLPLMDALFLESNPIPLKTALHLLGLCGETLRLPLVTACAATRTRVAEALCLSTEGTLPGVL
jgi:4-hydroxy-tetrahydrodipicolinate synthase